MITLSKEQQKVHDDVIDWVNSFYRTTNKGYFVLSGLAGTGKTTLIGFIAKTIKSDEKILHNIAYCAYTGKASIVLKNKLKNIIDEDYVGTIHSLIYKPIIDQFGDISGWEKKLYLEYSLIIVDEGSMINEELWEDLLGYGKPIIVVGDHGQLPPIASPKTITDEFGNEKTIYPKEGFSLMKTPDLILHEIHRQALENPIIKLSLFARKYGYVPTKIFGKQVAKIDYVHQAAKDALLNYKLNDDTQILCGMNKTRVKLNSIVREQLGFNENRPMPNEKLICLKNNKKEYVMNGQMGIAKSVKLFKKWSYEITMEMDGEENNQIFFCYKNAFGKEKYGPSLKDLNKAEIKNCCAQGKKVNIFDWGYAISVHKAQGSEFKKLILVEERNYYQSDEDYARWLYTGITRACEKLLIIENFY